MLKKISDTHKLNPSTKHQAPSNNRYSTDHTNIAQCIALPQPRSEKYFQYLVSGSGAILATSKAKPSRDGSRSEYEKFIGF